MKCINCQFCKIIHDPDQEDWFNDDDQAILCTKADEDLVQQVMNEFEGSYTQILGKAPNFVAWHTAKKEKKALVASALRPYETPKTEAPNWCPIMKEQNVVSEIKPKTLSKSETERYLRLHRMTENTNSKVAFYWDIRTNKIVPDDFVYHPSFVQEEQNPSSN